MGGVGGLGSLGSVRKKYISSPLVCTTTNLCIYGNPILVVVFLC
ncbi:MAG: hypothetical protein AB4080_13810 [Trichodesmium sp.]